MRGGRSYVKFIGTVLLSALLIGCGSAATEAKGDQLRVLSGGGVELTISELFDKPYYSEEELVGSVEAELSAYNAARGEEAIRLTAHRLVDQRMELTLSFASYEDCGAYMDMDLYVGNIQGAYDAGYVFEQALTDRRHEERIIGKNDLMNMADRRIVIYTGDYTLTCPSAIDYYSFGMLPIDSRTVAPIPAEEGETPTGSYMVLY